MKLSWSQKLFLKINSQVGKNKRLDKFMIFCAHILIFILGFLILIWAELVLGGNDFKFFVKMIMTALVSYWVVAWPLALLLKKSRPVVAFPESKQLLHTMQTWKSFPSDHTSISFILALMPMVMGAGVLINIVFLTLASLISFGRVFVGVHYPRDIVGGIVCALFFSLTANWLVSNISQPVYEFFYTVISNYTT